jgi:hypothetical protein
LALGKAPDVISQVIAQKRPASGQFNKFKPFRKKCRPFKRLIMKAKRKDQETMPVYRQKWRVSGYMTRREIQRTQLLYFSRYDSNNCTLASRIAYLPKPDISCTDLGTGARHRQSRGMESA